MRRCCAHFAIVLACKFEYARRVEAFVVAVAVIRVVVRRYVHATDGDDLTMGGGKFSGSG